MDRQDHRKTCMAPDDLIVQRKVNLSTFLDERSSPVQVVLYVPVRLHGLCVRVFAEIELWRDNQTNCCQCQLVLHHCVSPSLLHRQPLQYTDVHTHTHTHTHTGSSAPGWGMHPSIYPDGAQNGRIKKRRGWVGRFHFPKRSMIFAPGVSITLFYTENDLEGLSDLKTVWTQDSQFIRQNLDFLNFGNFTL